MADYKKILNKELEKISLSSNEIAELNKVAKDFVSKMKEKKINCFIGGSLAKGTLIKKNKQDVDIFAVFDSEKEIDKLGRVIERTKLNGELKKIHGSRDYFQIDKGDIVLEIIPVVENKNPEEAENVTDVSLSHVKYVVNKIKKNKKIADEIKLAKAFCFANDVYGAESYIKGFSGYALELLVIHFGGFTKFLKGLSKKSKNKIIIDSKKSFKNEKEIMNGLNGSKLQGPVILIDPTYKYRNVTAGLGEETFQRFVVYAKEFLRKPSLNYFEHKAIDVDKMEIFARKKKARYLEIDFNTNKQEGDIAGTKMKKFFGFMIWELERKGQKVVEKEFYYPGKGQSGRGYLIVQEKKEVEIKGPETWMDEAVRKFKKVRKKVYVKSKSLYALEKVDIEDIFARLHEKEDEMGVRFMLLTR